MSLDFFAIGCQYLVMVRGVSSIESFPCPYVTLEAVPVVNRLVQVSCTKKVCLFKT